MFYTEFIALQLLESYCMINFQKRVVKRANHIKNSKNENCVLINYIIYSLWFGRVYVSLNVLYTEFEALQLLQSYCIVNF